MTARILRADDHPSVPWANGGGVTQDVVSWPPGGEEVEWRVSITPVTGPGAFSAYPGIDRVLTVASGGPLMLDVDGSALVAERLSPLRFDGGATTTCVDAGGGARVVNVMARRDAARATVSVLEVRAVGGMQPPSPVRAPAGGFLVAVVVRGTASVGDDLLTAYDAVLSLDDLDVSGPATLVVAKLEPVR